MRKILFRGKNAQDEWIYGCGYDRQLEKLVTRISPPEIDTFGAVYVRPETVGQYTGFKDRVKTQIFEGDILKDGKWTGMVNWDEKNGAWCVGDMWLCALPHNKDLEYLLLEVVRNIHDEYEEICAMTVLHSEFRGGK